MSILDAPGVPQTALSRLKNWGRSFNGPQSVFGVMSSPPTITFGGNSSSVNGSYVNGQTVVNGQDSRFEYNGSIFVGATAAGGYPIYNPSHITDSAGAKSGNTAPIRVRFMTDATAIDFAFQDLQPSQFNILVDGQFISRDRTAVFGNTGNYRYIKCDFGSDAVTYGKAVASIGSLVGGTGHAVGDVITFDGGTGSAAGTAVKMKVTQVSSGVVTNMDVSVKGAYTTVPTGTFTQVASTGSGVGVTFSASFFQPSHSTRKMRQIELIYSQPSFFLGIVVATNDIVLSARTSTSAPRVAFIGDSITIGTYVQYGACHMGSSIAQKLGWWDRHIISGIGGTGWNAGTTPWSHANRLQDFIDYNADLYVFIGSQNDAAGTSLENKIRDTLNSLMSARPLAKIVGVGNILGDSTTLANSIGNGFAAATNQANLRYINNHAPNKWIPSADQAAWAVNGDQNHLSQEGLDRFAFIAAGGISQAVLQMQ